MALIPCLLFLSLLSHSILLARCDEEDDLLKGINEYRTSLNLRVVSMSKGADCVADGIAQGLKNQSCRTNTTSTTLSSYPALVTKCGLNTTNTSVNGQILPACVPDHQPNLVLSNFTSKYATYLNSTNFSAIGIASEDDWIVMVLTNFNGASVLTTITPLMFSLICLFMLLYI